MLTEQQIVSRLRYQGKQYANGQVARGGVAEPHYLEQAADLLEQKQAALDEVLKEAVWAMELIQHRIVDRAGCHAPKDPNYQRAQAFLDTYRTRQEGRDE